MKTRRQYRYDWLLREKTKEKRLQDLEVELAVQDLEPTESIIIIENELKDEPISETIEEVVQP